MRANFSIVVISLCSIVSVYVAVLIATVFSVFSPIMPKSLRPSFSDKIVTRKSAATTALGSTMFSSRKLRLLRYDPESCAILLACFRRCSTACAWQGY
jgi:hypothetical protein